MVSNFLSIGKKKLKKKKLQNTTERKRVLMYLFGSGQKGIVIVQGIQKHMGFKLLPLDSGSDLSLSQLIWPVLRRRTARAPTWLFPFFSSAVALYSERDVRIEILMALPSSVMSRS